MATYTLTGGHRHSPMTDRGAAGTSALRWLFDRIRGLANRMEERRLYRETFRELDALSTRELDDIGIARADIPKIARKSAARSRNGW